MVDPPACSGCPAVPSQRSQSPAEYSATFPIGQSTETLTTSASLGARLDRSHSADDDSSSFQTGQSLESSTTRSSRAATMMANAFIVDIGIMRFMCFARETPALDENKDPSSPPFAEDKKAIPEPIMIKDVFVRSPPTSPINRSHVSAFTNSSARSTEPLGQIEDHLAKIDVALRQNFSRQLLPSSDSVKRNDDKQYEENDRELHLVPTLCSTMTAGQSGSIGHFFCFNEGRAALHSTALQFLACGGNGDTFEADTRSLSLPRKSSDSKVTLPSNPIITGFACCDEHQTTNNLETHILLPPSETEIVLETSDATKAELEKCQGAEEPKESSVIPSPRLSWSVDGKEIPMKNNQTSWLGDAKGTIRSEYKTSWSSDAIDAPGASWPNDGGEESQRDLPTAEESDKSSSSSPLSYHQSTAKVADPPHASNLRSETMAIENFDDLIRKAKREQQEKRIEYYRQRRQIFLESHVRLNSWSESSAHDASISSAADPVEKQLTITFADPPFYVEKELTISFDDQPVLHEKILGASFEEEPFDCVRNHKNEGTSSYVSFHHRTYSSASDCKTSDKQTRSASCHERMVQPIPTQSDILSLMPSVQGFNMHQMKTPDCQTPECPATKMPGHLNVESLPSHGATASLVPTCADSQLKQQANTNLKASSSERLVKPGAGRETASVLAGDNSGHSRSRRADRLHFLKTVRGIKKTGSISPPTVQPTRTMAAHSPTPSACSLQSSATEFSVRSDNFHRHIKALQSLAPPCRQPNYSATQSMRTQPKKVNHYNAPISQKDKLHSHTTPNSQATKRKGAHWRYWERPAKPSDQ